jgi:hypothetical protein
MKKIHNDIGGEVRHPISLLICKSSVAADALAEGYS